MKEKRMIISIKLIAGAIATLSLHGAALGSGMIWSNLINATSRNPSLKADLFSLAILGFALTEAIGLFSLMMAFMILFAF